MIKFSIFIPTYNRPNLVRLAIESVLNQTYHDFEILLFDNGSQPPVSITEFPDPRIRFFRNEINIQPTTVGENALNEMNGTHFIFLADDDALVPSALEIVNVIVETNPEIEILNTGFIHFDHSQHKIIENPEVLQKFSGSIESYNSREAMLYYFNGYWGIGERKNYSGPHLSHSSGCFIKKSLIEKTRDIQKELMVKTFGDVGYIGTLMHTKSLFYLDLPLAIVGQTTISDSAGCRLGNRTKIDQRYKNNLEYTPIRGLSFINVGTDTHLRVIYRNNLQKIIDCRLRPDFYFFHLQSVISDSPWTRQTIRDIVEVIPHLCISLIQFRSIKEIRFTISSLIPIMKLWCSDIKKKLTSFSNSNAGDPINESGGHINSNKFFANINDAGKWVNEKYIMPQWRNNEIYKSK